MKTKFTKFTFNGLAALALTIGAVRQSRAGVWEEGAAALSASIRTQKIDGKRPKRILVGAGEDIQQQILAQSEFRALDGRLYRYDAEFEITGTPAADPAFFSRCGNESGFPDCEHELHQGYRLDIGPFGRLKLTLKDEEGRVKDQKVLPLTLAMIQGSPSFDRAGLNGDTVLSVRMSNGCDVRASINGFRVNVEPASNGYKPAVAESLSYATADWSVWCRESSEREQGWTPVPLRLEYSTTEQRPYMTCDDAEPDESEICKTWPGEIERNRK